MSKRYIYLIANNTGAKKIGVSGDIHNRLRALQGASGELLTLLRSWPIEPMGSYIPDPLRIERDIHRILQASRMLGEWFRCGEQEAIKAVEMAIDKAELHRIQTNDLITVNIKGVDKVAWVKGRAEAQRLKMPMGKYVGMKIRELYERELLEEQRLMESNQCNSTASRS